MTPLTQDTVAVTLKTIKDTSLALVALQQLLTKDEMDAGMPKRFSALLS